MWHLCVSARAHRSGARGEVYHLIRQLADQDLIVEIDLPMVVTAITAFLDPSDISELGWSEDGCRPVVPDEGRGEAVMAGPQSIVLLEA